MATEAVRAGLPLSTRHLPVPRSHERAFFGGIAILLCAVVVFGFSRTYFAAGMVLAPLPNVLVHIHGGAFTLWMVLYLVQSALVSAKRVMWHRTLGTIAFCLPPIMVVLGVAAALDGVRRGTHIGGLPTNVSLAIPLFGIATYADGHTAGGIQCADPGLIAAADGWLRPVCAAPGASQYDVGCAPHADNGGGSGADRDDADLAWLCRLPGGACSATLLI